jgi:hypothetical protein
MFGRWGYFVGDRLFACFPLREKEHDLWMRLSLGDQAKSLAVRGIRPHRRFGRRGWIECEVECAGDVDRALPWLRRAYESAWRVYDGARRGVAAEPADPDGS